SKAGLLHGDRQKDRKLRAFSRFSQLADSALVCVNDTLHNGKAEAHSLNARGEERLEYPLLVLLRYARSGVGKSDLDVGLNARYPGDLRESLGSGECRPNVQLTPAGHKADR